MKTCFSTFACPDWDLRKIIEAAQKYSYDGIEIRCDAGQAHAVELWASDKERVKIAERISKARLEVPVLATSLMLARDDFLEQAVKRVELAKDIGAQAIRVFCGNPEMPITDHEILALAVQNLRRIAEITEYVQMPILLETNDRMSTAVKAADVVRRAESERLGVVWNNLHTFRKGETIAESMAAMKGMLGHVHFHDGRNFRNESAITPMGEGDMPMEETFSALLNAGYEGYLCGEWFYDQYGETPDESLERYRAEIAGFGLKNEIVIV